MYCSVLGNLEEMMGIVFYLGPNGFRCLKELVLTEDEVMDYEELGYRQDGIICFFPDKEELMPEELDELDQVGLHFADGSQVPAFKRYSPGWMPSALMEEDLEALLVGLEQAMLVCSDMGDDPSMAEKLGVKEDGTVLARVQNETGKWGYEKIQTDSVVELSPNQVSLTRAEEQSLVSLPRMDKIWLFEHFFFNMPSFDELGGRAFFPKALVLLEVEQASVVGIEAVTPSEFPGISGQFLTETFQAVQYVPQQIVVASRENYILLKQFCKGMGIDLYLDAEMHMVPELRETVMEMFSEDDEV